jgi:hypothetical protein
MAEVAVKQRRTYATYQEALRAVELVERNSKTTIREHDGDGRMDRCDTRRTLEPPRDPGHRRRDELGTNINAAEELDQS